MDAHFEDEDEVVEDDDDAGGGGVLSIFVAAARTWGCVKRKTAKTAVERMNAIVDWSLGNTVDWYRSMLLLLIRIGRPLIIESKYIVGKVDNTLE